jgi:TonB family protein
MKPLRALLAAALLATLPAAAAERLPPPDIQAPVYATRVDSTIEIGPDGSVVGYEPITELKDPLASRVRAIAEGFRFEPVLVDGKPVIARTRMRMHLVAEPVGDGDLQLKVEHVGFPEGEGEASPVADRFARGIAKRTPIKYPEEALYMGLSGRVMVAFRFGPDGKVLEAIPRESALYGVKGREASLAKALAIFERAAVQAVRRWTIDVQVPDGAVPRPEDLTASINIEYLIERHPQPRPGLWLHESRSRERPLPWLDPMLAGNLPDMADVDDGIHFGAAPARFRLLTPIGGIAL